MKWDRGLRVAQEAFTEDQIAHLSALVECSRDLVWPVDLDYRLVTFNRVFAEEVHKNWGVTAKPGLRSADITSFEHAAWWPKYYERALTEGPYRGEYTLDGIQWLELHFNPITIDGRNIGVSVLGERITERKLAEERIKASEARFRTLVENAPGAVVICREDAILYVNRRFGEMFGVEDLASLTECRIGEFSALECRERVEELSRQWTRGESAPNEYEAIGRREDGSQFPVQVVVSTVELPDGPAVLGFLRDITVRKENERALRESEARFRSFFNLQLMGMVITLPGKGFIEVNDRFCEMVGYSREELLKTTRSAITHPDDIERNSELIERVKTGKLERFSLEMRFIRKDGSAVWTTVSVGCVRKSDGSIDHICAMVEDISERKAAEEAIHKAEEKYRQIFEEAPEGIFKTTPDGRALSINPSGARILGYESSEEAINAIRDLAHQVWLHPEDRTAYMEVLERGGKIHSQPYEFKRKDGTPVWIAMTARCVCGEDGRTQYYQGYFDDISEKKQLEEELSEHLRDVKLLSEMNEALLRARSEKELLQNYCRIIVETGGYRVAWVGFAEAEPEKRVVPVAWFGQEDGYLSEVEIRWDGGELSKGPTGKAVISGQIEVAQDYETYSGLKPFVDRAAKRGYKSSIAVPFRLAQNSMACLTAYGATRNAWSESERALMVQVASALGFGISTLRTAIAKDQSQRDLRASLEQTIQVIAGTVDQRDPYTAGHQRRVADLSARIAQKMGLDEDRVHGLHLAATIHDLGKLGVPAEILSKPGRLSPIQSSLVREHAQMGYENVRNVHFPWPIADMVWEHHERMDGSGYPRGLKGDAILLESRILAVADVVEAMASHRPYRASLGIDAALEEIQRGRGTLFDPEVVDACVRVFREDGFSLSEQSE